MVEEQSPLEVGESGKLYPKIGDFVLDFFREEKKEDGSLRVIVAVYLIPREVWESKTGMTFELNGDKLECKWPSLLSSQLTEAAHGKKFAQITKLSNYRQDFLHIYVTGKFEIKIALTDDKQSIRVMVVHINSGILPNPDVFTQINESIFGLKRFLYPEEAKPVELAPAPDVPAYVLIGHGVEVVPESYDKRSVLPDGITLVTVSTCDSLLYSPLLINMLKAMQGIGEEKDISMFKDPARNKEAIRKAFRSVDFNVYKPGDPYPNLLYKPVFDVPHDTPYPMSQKLMIRHTTYSKSGVYKLPITLQSFKDEWEVSRDGKMYIHKNTHFLSPYIEGDEMSYHTISRHDAYAGDDVNEIPAEILEKIYKDSVWPPVKTTEAVKAQYPIEKVFEALGSGVYYWAACRSFDDRTLYDKKVTQTRAESRSRHATRGYGRKRKTYRKKKKLLKHHTRNNVHRF